jgi:hypothetical protein
MALEDKQNRTISLNISKEQYPSFMKDNGKAHQVIQRAYAQNPELFPPGMRLGYKLNGKTRPSKKLGLRLRRIEIQGTTYRLRPCFVLPYMRATTSQVKHAMFLLRFGVPFWALAVVFGRNAMFWYRTFICLSRFSVAGTTLHRAENLPEHLLADEFHIRLRGQKAYVATTAAQGCILGAEACGAADEASLSLGYNVFKEEARQLDPHYQPATVNTDGWWATQKAWRALFKGIFIIECFLHAFLKIRDRATKKLQPFFETAADKVWDIYRAESKKQMGQRIRRLGEWAKKTLPDCPMRENVLKLCKKRKRWLAHFDFPSAYRTSSQLDRVMRLMERHAINSQMFHADLSSTSKNFRALALLHNFSPSCPAVAGKAGGLASPAARLNGFTYHQDWLQNLLLAASLNGYRRQLRNPL